MHPRDAIARLVGLVRGGLLDRAHHEVATFPLAEANAAEGMRRPTLERFE